MEYRNHSLVRNKVIETDKSELIIFHSIMLSYYRIILSTKDYF